MYSDYCRHIIISRAKDLIFYDVVIMQAVMCRS